MSANHHQIIFSNSERTVSSKAAYTNIIYLFPKHLTHFIIKISHVEARDPAAYYVNLDDKPFVIQKLCPRANLSLRTSTL